MTSITKKQIELPDELLKDFNGNAEDLLGDYGLIQALTKRGLERLLEGEMTAHLGYTPHAPAGLGSGNSRNGKNRKTLQSTHGQLDIEVPQDRNGEFEPQIVKKHQRRLAGLDGKIIGLYARGLSVSDIQAELLSLYGV